MPSGTPVDRCFQKLKQSRGQGSAAAICQSSTGQNLHTGKPLHKSIKNQSLRCSKFLKKTCTCNHCSHHV